MGMYLLAVSFITCFISVSSIAANASADDARSAKERTGSAGAALQVFIHPDTGEILTYEQWHDLGIEDEQSGGESLVGRNSRQTRDSSPVLNGRFVELENGDYVVIVNAPEGAGAKTRVHFDEAGKAHMECTHSMR